MTQSIAVYFIEELDSWMDSIHFHLEETNDLQQLLQDLLQRNSLPQMAGKVEHYMNSLMLSWQKFMDIEYEIRGQRSKLESVGQPILNELVDNIIKGDQNRLRDQMLETEKEYLDLKFASDRFISESILTHQVKKNN